MMRSRCRYTIRKYLSQTPDHAHSVLEAGAKVAQNERELGWAGCSSHMTRNLAARLRQGEHDERADLDAQLAAHKDVMICVAAALVGPADAEDAAQEASLRAWRSWDELRDSEAVRSWLLRITVNVCHDWLRGRFGTRVRRTESLDAGGDIATLDLDRNRL